MFSIVENNWGFITPDRTSELEKIFDSIGSFFPNENLVLRFLNMDFDNLKYVIVGMEPYPSSFVRDGVVVPEATGRSFEVESLRGKTWDAKFKQSSLRNILKAIYYARTGKNGSMEEIRKNIRDGIFPMSPPNEWFDLMEKQGVLFLNASLTVEPGNVGSHKQLWDKFVTDLIQHIEENRDVTWLLWGKDAQERVLPHVKNYVLSCHPRLPEFVTENCFKNEKLQGVNWVV